MGNEGKHIITWIDRFEKIAIDNAWDEAKQCRTIPLCLAKLVLIFYNSLLEATKDNRELVKDDLRRTYHSEDRQWHLWLDLNALTQTSTHNTSTS